MNTRFTKLLRNSAALLVVVLAGCSTESVVYFRHELMEQILRPRQGFHGLTNRACSAWDEKKTCTAYEVKDHALEDQAFRDTLIQLGFICNVGGRRFKICPDKAGVCRTWYTRSWFLAPKVRHEEFIPASNYQLLLDSRTRCFKKELYPFDGVWGTSGVKVWGQAP